MQFLPYGENPRASLPQNKKQDTLRANPPDSLIWKDTEFMN